MHNHDFDFKNLSADHLDALQEVGNIGAGHAAIALTKFLNRSTYMSIPKVVVENISAIPKLIKMPGEEHVGIITSKTVSDLLYTSLVFLDQESIYQIIDLMTDTPGTKHPVLNSLSPLYKSLIKEIGSILLLKYTEALNDFLKAKSFPSPPKLRIGTVKSLQEHELAELDQDTSVLFIECDIFTSEKNITVDLAIVPHKGTFKKFMTALFSENQ